MEKKVTKLQAKNATKVLAKYSKQETAKAYESGKKGAIKLANASKVRIAKMKSFFK